ncbi:hypothetical protein PHYSODRAFT_488972 [Phytophthora sojae]|uniref:OTU domain-containing protein n=1 Tax=Phytophthora sojae (strain P6497) TaxID=1094619 RepID=G4Z648_PHYSP|nr:hypothetical protein PHYSODRAFT_488972 [Phytophthora sojae]EGZ20969.1 hypothetical protein PHYSODRAFT_488972 [Phytophthora sojae]|eukprot:XP_009523686.1 hypothetical protein PHYSODRAFT_488972 [Phytophthora sojae]
MHEWHLRYQHLVGDDEEDEREQICLQPPAWYLPEDTHSSLFCCLRHSLASSIADYAHVLTSYMRELDDLKGLFDDNNITSLRNGERDGSEHEIFAAAQLHSCNIQVKTLNDECRVTSAYTFAVTNPFRSVCIARHGSYYAVQVDGMHI